MPVIEKAQWSGMGAHNIAVKPLDRKNTLTDEGGVASVGGVHQKVFFKLEDLTFKIHLSVPWWAANEER